MSHDMQNPQFDPRMGKFKPYTAPRMTLSTAQTLLGVPNSFEGYSVRGGVGMLAVFSESTPRVSDSRVGGIDIQMKPLMEQQLEALQISATMAHLTPLDDYISTYWHTFHTFCPIIHRGAFDPAANILLSSAIAAIGTQYHNTAAARQKGVELNDYCRRTIDLVSVASLILGIYF